MKKYISVFAIMLMIFLAACSNQNISSAPTSNESNTQSNSVTKLEEGVWPANEYTEGLPVPPGTVAWATLDTEHGNCSINLTGVSENDYNEYMEILNQEGFSVIENVSEEIEGENYVSIGTLLSNEEKWISISYVPDSFGIYILTNEKFVQFAEPEPDEEHPFIVCGQTVLLCNVTLAAALSTLPEQAQEEIFRYYFLHQPQRVIGAYFGQTRSTAGRHIQLALQRLREEMEVSRHE